MKKMKTMGTIKWGEKKSKLYMYRRMYGFRQEDVAKKIGMGVRSYIDIERDKVSPRLTVAKKIAKFFCIKVSDLWDID